MTKITGRKLELKQDEIVIQRPDGKYLLDRKISGLGTSADINPENYAFLTSPHSFS